MHPEKFTTLFLNWEKRGTVWVAREPTKSEMRWVIREPDIITPQIELEVGFVFAGGEFCSVCQGKNPVLLGWIATGHRIKQIAELSDRYSHVLSGPEQNAYPAFLARLTTINWESPDERVAQT